MIIHTIKTTIADAKKAEKILEMLGVRYELFYEGDVNDGTNTWSSNIMLYRITKMGDDTITVRFFDTPEVTGKPINGKFIFMAPDNKVYASLNKKFLC